MSALVGPALAFAQSAAEIAGVPFLGSAISLVKAIQENCERIQAHKGDCKRLSQKAAQLINALQQQNHRLKESQLREYADEVESTLRTLNKRTSVWASYGPVRAFFQDSKIADGIKECESDLDTAIKNFHVNAAIVISCTQEQLAETVRHSQGNLEELVQILRNKDVINQLPEFQRPVSASITQTLMDAGHQQLQLLRDKEGGPSQPDANAEYEETQRSMSQLFSKTGIPPTTRILNGEIKTTGDRPYFSGVVCDVWVGYWLGDQKVALKKMRGAVRMVEKTHMRFEQEFKVWATLSHPRVLPFIGIVIEPDQSITLVSPWQECGDILDFIRRHKDADRLHLLFGAAEGLAYLHSQGVIHGNVRCSNILVATGGNAVICDFGVAKVVGDITNQTAAMTISFQGSERWMAPELLTDPSVTIPTPMCDVYSMGMTMLECFTLHEPFKEIKRRNHVTTMMSQGALIPERPKDVDAQKWVDDEVWKLMMRCWSRQPEDRPPMQEVSTSLAAFGSKARLQRFHSAPVVPTSQTRPATPRSSLSHP